MQYVTTRCAIVAAAVFSSSLIAVAQSSGTLPPPKFLYSTDNAGGKVYGYLVNASTGTIKSTGQLPRLAHTGPTRAVSDKGGYRLYVINSQSKDLNAYFINRSNGYLSSVPGSPFKIGQTPTGVAVHPTGHYVYVTAKNNWVYAFHVLSNGSLATVPGSPFSTVSAPQTLAIDPQGKYLYVS